MKKGLRTVLILSMCVAMGLGMTGCGNSKPYSNYDLSEYITLPDYDAFETSVPAVSIAEEDVEAEIEAILESAKTTEDVKEGTVKKGNTVKISFKGTLSDGSSPENMKSDEYSLTLGEGGMIDGFEEGIYGAKIGDTVTMNLTFPDPYTSNEELSGQAVTFEVGVLSKTVENTPVLSDEFVKENSDFATVAEYKAYVAKELEQEEYDSQLYEIKSELYAKIVNGTEVIKYPEKELKKQKKEVDESYKQMAKTSGADWEDYRNNTLGVDKETYESEIEAYAKELVKQEMIIYAISEKEELTVTDEEYDEYLKAMLESSGFEDDAAFKEYSGMTIEKYAKSYKMDRDLLLTKELDAIYDRLLSKTE